MSTLALPLHVLYMWPLLGVPRPMAVPGRRRTKNCNGMEWNGMEWNGMAHQSVHVSEPCHKYSNTWLVGVFPQPNSGLGMMAE
jgi:hypothetical protein